jgi:hypothetical protein
LSIVLRKPLDQFISDGLGIGVLDRTGSGEAYVFVDKLDVTALEIVAPFAPDGDHLGLLAGVFVEESLRGFYDVGIERTSEAFVAADEDDQVLLITALIEQRMRDLARDLTAQVAEHLTHLARKWARRRHAVLRALELRRRDHLHRLGDLLCVLDRLDPPAHVQKTCHSYLSFKKSSSVILMSSEIFLNKNGEISLPL